MPFYIPYSEDYLAHHGILGMKWGVRRYQNKDGSYTELGRKHYGHEKRQSQKQYGGLFTKKTPEEKAAAQERKARSKIDALKRKIEENEDEIVENSRTADEYAKKAEEHRAIASGYQKKSDEYTHANEWLEWSNSRSNKKIQKLEKEIEALQAKKMSDVEPNLDDLKAQTQRVRDVNLEREETTLKDYFSTKKKQVDNWDPSAYQNRSFSASQKESYYKNAKNNDKWDMEFLEAIQNSKISYDGDTKAMLKEYRKYLDHPYRYTEEEARKLEEP